MENQIVPGNKEYIQIVDRTRKLLFLLGLFLFGMGFNPAFAQKAQISGIIKTNKGEAVPYASVALYDSTRQLPVTGEASDSTGHFSLSVEPGSYTLKISFLSFKPYRRQLILHAGEQRSLGVIRLEPAIQSMQNVVVQGQRTQMELTFEKRTFRVGKDITSLGGSALDVLNNVPSLTTDFNGTISLRGSSSVRILVNGKPSSIYQNGSKALQSLSADMIKEVQVITNPSAKYSAEGSAGIINIVLKKKQHHGFHGSVGFMQRHPEATQLSSNLNYRTDNINWFFNGSVAHAEDPAHNRTYQRYNTADTSYVYRAFNNGNETDYHGDFKLGADVHLPAKQTLTVSDTWHFENKADYWNGAYLDSTFSGVFLDRIDRHNRIGGGEGENETSLEYKNPLGGDHHRLTADAEYSYSNHKELPHIREVNLQNPSDTLFHQINDTGKGHNLRFNAAYVHPVADSGKVELGLRSSYNWLDNNYTARERQNSGGWQTLTAFNNNYASYENTNSAYATLSSYWASLSYQLGLRVEQYHIQTALDATGKTSRQTYLNLFPSAFLTYKFNDQRSLQLSYSRRISRPYARLLLPTTSYSDSRSRFTGNPGLKPEYANSYEAEFLQYWDTGSLLSSVYYRHRTGVIRDITKLDNQGIMRTTPFNLSREDAWGIELTAEKDVTDHLTLTGSANLFRSSSKGIYQGELYQTSTNRLTSRLQLHWEIPSSIKFQTSIRYNGPANTIQGHRSATAFVNAALSKDFWDGNATVSINSEDLLNTRREESTITNPDYFSRQKFWEPSGIRLNFTYRINQKKGDGED
ncbi:MAG TPA: outer membrane beta-barrel family protein [Balneolaceae bacterium]|nr:outer membrane beta-barrel family protein [Balneolaceae bacterium]